MDEIAQIDRFRSFSRRVALRTGVLESSYLGRGRPLGQARLLFEIGPRGGDLRQLREKLGLDSGYASRLLKSLAAQGLVSVRADPADGRRRHVTLTPKGLAEHAAYDALSDALARSVLSPLGATQRARLVAAMAEVEALRAAGSDTFAVEAPDSADARACLDAYFSELAARFDMHFDPTAGGYSAATGPGLPQGAFIVARLDGRAVGCGVWRALDATTGEIKRMWIAPDMRGRGLSRRLLETLESAAAAAGMARIRLDTNKALTEAKALYLKAGYAEIPRYNDNPYAHLWFEKALAAPPRDQPPGRSAGRASLE